MAARFAPLVALFRAREDAARTSDALAAHGFVAAIAPVVELKGLTPTAPPGRFDFAIATSAKAIAFAPPPLLALCRGLPLYLVGARTAAAARGAGLDAQPPAADVAALLPTLPPGRAIHLAARDRKPDLADALGGQLEVAVVYEARARAAWTRAEAHEVSRAAAALHYSARHAALAATLAEANGLIEAWRRLPHICLSREVGAPLAALGANSVTWPDAPHGTALFDTLRAALGEAGL